jgi:hypothetical protein
MQCKFNFGLKFKMGWHCVVLWGTSWGTCWELKSMLRTQCWVSVCSYPDLMKFHDFADNSARRRWSIKWGVQLRPNKAMALPITLIPPTSCHLKAVLHSLQAVLVLVVHLLLEIIDVQFHDGLHGKWPQTIEFVIICHRAILLHLWALWRSSVSSKEIVMLPHCWSSASRFSTTFGLWTDYYRGRFWVRVLYNEEGLLPKCST